MPKKQQRKKKRERMSMPENAEEHVGLLLLLVQLKLPSILLERQMLQQLLELPVPMHEHRQDRRGNDREQPGQISGRLVGHRELLRGRVLGLRDVIRGLKDRQLGVREGLQQPLLVRVPELNGFRAGEMLLLLVEQPEEGKPRRQSNFTS
tara:strand:- start:77 stop:526 length:450 start_codon:yes stop_codon:yes gene_type:complete